MKPPMLLLAVALLGLSVASFAKCVQTLVRGGEEVEVTAVVKSHEAATEYISGSRSTQSKWVDVTRVTFAYEASGEERTFSTTIHPDLAPERYPLGATLPAYVDAEGAREPSLEPNSARTLALILFVAGVWLLGAAVVMFFMGRQT